MRIAVLSGDEKLEAALLARTRPGVEWSFYNREELFLSACREAGFERMIVQAERFGLKRLEDIAEAANREGDASRMLLLDKGSDAGGNSEVRELCERLGIAALQPERSAEAMAEEAGRWLFGGAVRHEGGKLIAFVGTTPNIGTTLVSYGAAVRLALDSEASVGYMCLNLKSSKLHRYRGQESAAATLDGIRAELKAQRLDGNRLYGLCEPVRGVPGLRVLYGNMLREQAEFFRPEEIECLLQAARSAFDVCVVEVNAYWDNAATVCVMLHADVRVAVTTGEISHFQEDMHRWVHTVGPIFGLSSGSLDLVVNQLDKRSMLNGIRAKEVRKETGMRLAAEIARFPDIPGYLNEGKILELFTGDHPIRQPAARMADRWIRQWGLPRSAGRTERTRMKRWLSGWRSTFRKVEFRLPNEASPASAPIPEGRRGRLLSGGEEGERR
ncbi:CpaE family protein [Paenibacillus sp. MBLB4367]|uniref:AAA family ATPase n=1 Tax=Paenibacillus sp. MBLB4367 TaxID=3384767 RepID=UPI003907F291